MVQHSQASRPYQRLHENSGKDTSFPAYMQLPSSMDAHRIIRTTHIAKNTPQLVLHQTNHYIYTADAPPGSTAIV